MPCSHSATRRDLLRSALVVAAGSCTCSAGALRDCCTVPDATAVRFQESLVEIDLSQTPQLEKVGSAVKIEDENRKLRLLIAHTGKNRFVAIDEKCTHGGGHLTYVHKRQVVHCTCWGHAEFGLDGRVLFWPNSREGKPLSVYPVRVDGKRLAITVQA